MIDWNRIAELRHDVLGEDFPEVFDIFREEVEEILRGLSDAPNFASFEEHFHFLKGSALNVGFTEFGEMCFAAEKACADGKAMTIDVDQVLDCYKVSLSALFERADEFGLAA